MNSKTMFKCNICDKTFTRKFTLENHIGTQHEKKGYLCEICKVRISRRRPHSCAVENGVCECYVCGLRFISSKAMFRHRNLAHPVDQSAEDPDTEKVLDAIILEIKQPALKNFQPSIDSLLEKTLLVDEEDPPEICFKNHPALRHFQLTENTVVYCEGILFLKCPLCLDTFNTFDSLKEHIESYPFLVIEQKNKFFDTVSEIITDMETTFSDAEKNDNNTSL